MSNISTISNRNKNQTAWASILAIISVFYAVSPLDIIPDIPVIGWIDDFFVVTAAGLNLLEKVTGETNHSLRQLLKVLKWIVIAAGVVVILLLLLLGTLIYNMVA